MIINPYLVQPSGASYGTLTTAWIAATGETDTTILGALNTLESDLTTYGLTSKIKALYPMAGGTSTKHSYNFMNTAQYQITFNGGWTHSSTGALPNGTNAYANTGLNPSSVLSSNSSHLSHYSRTQVTNTNSHDIGCESSAGSVNLDLFQYYSAVSNKGYIDGGYPTDAVQSNNTDTTGFLIGSRTSSASLKLYFDNSLLNTNTTVKLSGYPSYNIFIGASNQAGVAGAYSTKECALASIGDGLTDAEAANLYTAVQTFQTTLGRQVGVPIVSDADAQAFLNAAVITDTTQASAINTLVTDLKGYGIWTKMKAIYPFVGGTSTTHKYNLKDPQDTDAAFRLVFSGGWTHSSTGALANKTNTYADTNVAASSIMTASSGCMGVYIRNNDSGGKDIGAFSGPPDYENALYARYSDSKTYISYGNVAYTSASETDSRGFFAVNRNSSTTTNGFKNGSQILTFSQTGNISTARIAIAAAFNNNTASGEYTGHEYALAFMSDGLTSTEHSNLYTAVQAFQTTLSRNV